MSDVKVPKRVEVEWFDARAVYEQIELSHVAEKVQLTRRFSLGYLVFKDRERLIIAATFDPAEKRLSSDHAVDEDGGADFTVIPRGWIKAITELQVVSGPPEKEEA